jgi:cytoskeletal protein CcmA (bactofilin family)
MSPIDDPMGDHFDEVTGLLYLEDQLGPERALEVSEHVHACPRCASLLHALEREGVWLREALAVDEEPVPARVMAAPARGGAWGWFVAFGLGIGGAYTVWSELIEPWLSQAAQAGFTQGNVLTMLFFTGAFWKGWDAMRSAMEFMAVATLAGVAIWLLRKQWQRITTIALVMGAIVCALALPPAASAADIEHGDPSYTLPAGQEVKTDLIVIADRTRIDGDVDGDLVAFSDSVIVNGHIKGDVLAFGQAVHVNGSVDGNVRAWAQDLYLNGTVGRNVSGWNGTLDMDNKATVGGTMTLFVGAGELDGRVAGDLLAAGGDITVEGKLGRDAQIWSQRLTIGPAAEIDGHTKYQGRRQPAVSPSAKLASPIAVKIKGPGPDYASGHYYWHQVLGWGASFIFGLAILLLVPGFFADAEQAIKRIGPAVGFGALFLFATPIVAIIVCITIVGLGVGIATLLLYGIALYAAQIWVAAWLGEQLLGGGVGVGPAIGKLAIGLAVLRILRMIPYVGPLVGLLIVLWGMGALVLAIHKRLRPQLAPATA